MIFIETDMTNLTKDLKSNGERSMWKMTLTTNRDETVTIFVAGDAFNNIQPPIDDTDKVNILHRYAIRMIASLRQKAPNTALPSEPIYVESLTFAGLDATVVQYLQPEPNKVIRQRASVPTLRAEDNEHTIAENFKRWNMKWQDERDPGVVEIKRRNIFAQPLPPSTAEDDAAILQPPHGDQVKIEFKRLLRTVLTQLKYRTDDNQPLQDIVDEIADFSEETLHEMKALHLLNIPENENSESLNDFIGTQAGHVLNSRDYTFLHHTIHTHIAAEYQFQEILLNIAKAIHQAASDYLAQLWAQHRGNIDQLEADRVAINNLFDGLAYVNDDMSLQPIIATYYTLLNKKLTKDTLQALIAHLLNNAYQHNGLFEILAAKLNELSMFVRIARQTFTSHQVSFNGQAAETCSSYDKSADEMHSITKGCIFAIQENIRKSKELVQEQIRKTIPASQQRTESSGPNFWQRNKATIISLCLGAAIAVGAAVALALTLAMPPLGIGLIIAGTVAGIMGAATLIGRLIDKCKPAKKINENATKKEHQLLLDGFDGAFENAPATGKNASFFAKRSALSANSLLASREELTPDTNNKSTSTHRLT